MGDRASIQECLSAWDETESITLGTACGRPPRPFYSKVAIPLLAEQASLLPFSVDASRISRCNTPANLNQRLHLPLVGRNVRFQGQPVWIGQVGHDIGVRFTLKTYEHNQLIQIPIPTSMKRGTTSWMTCCSSAVSRALATLPACRRHRPLRRAAT